MGKPGHDQDDTILKHDTLPKREIYKTDDPNDPLNFTRKHPLFNIELEKKGPEFSDID